jgi:FdhE protein
VAAEFLRKLIGRPSELPADVAEAMAELSRRATEKPALADAANILGDILPGLYSNLTPSEAPIITSEQAVAKWAGGVPLLRGETVPLDLTAFARRWQHVCAAVERTRKGPIGDALRRSALEPRQMTAEVIAGRPGAVHARADELGLDAGQVATVLRLTLFPVLTGINDSLIPLRTGRWDHGYCPTCGSWPLLGEFRGLEQTRFLRCGLCAAEWEFPRLRCPYCDTADHNQLGYFFVEAEDGKFRAATCGVCKGYVKMISTLAALSPPRLLVADLETMHLDLAAADRGFVPFPVAADA